MVSVCRCKQRPVLAQIATDAKSSEMSELRCALLHDPASTTIAAEAVVDADHGRIETRTATVATDIA